MKTTPSLSEEQEQRQVVQWFKLQYPHIIINVDMGGVKLTIGLATKVKRSGHQKGFPDIFIAYANGKYSGLFIEFKKSGTKVFKANGEIRRDKHLIEQHKILNKLREQGYRAEFSIGYDNTIKLIKNYMEEVL